MKVKDLVQALQKLDPELDVYVTSEDEDVVLPGYAVRPFEIVEVTSASVLRDRDSMGRPEISAAAEGAGVRTALLEVTSQF